MTTLYEITGQMKELNALSEDEDMALAISDTLESFEMEFNEKAENILMLINNKSSDVEAINIEIARLTNRKKQIDNFNNNLREYLRINMESSGIKTIKCPLFTITLAKDRDIVEIENIDKLPDEFVKVELKTTPIKADILKSLKAGEEVEGAILKKSNSSIRIK